jgi:hypothetical protein
MTAPTSDLEENATAANVVKPESEHLPHCPGGHNANEGSCWDFMPEDAPNA